MSNDELSPLSATNLGDDILKLGADNDNFYSRRHSHFKTINSLSAVVIVDVVEVFVLIKSLHIHISPIPTYAVFTGEPLA